MALSSRAMVHLPSGQLGGAVGDRGPAGEPAAPQMSAAIDRLATTVADLAAAVESIRTLSAPGDGDTEQVPAVLLASEPADDPAAPGGATDADGAAQGGGSGGAPPPDRADATPSAPAIGVEGVRRLLSEAPEKDVERFYRAALGPLLVEDARQRGELSRTLLAYLECGGNTVQAAKRVCAHRNTVLYRLDRLNQLLGRDLRDPQVRFVLQLALHAREASRDLPGHSGHSAGILAGADTKRDRSSA
jgi:hypothetical protein